MYHESELPLVREYKKEWDKATKKKETLEFTIPEGDIKFDYSPPWMFTGTGSNTDAAFHYLSGDPYQDIDMLLIKLDNTDAKLAVLALQGILASLTSPYASDKSDEVTINNKSYFVKSLTQGQDENVLHTRFYSMIHNGEAVIMIFAWHEKANENADKLIDDFLDGVSFK